MNQRQRISVLIVDDNDMMRTVLRGILRAEEEYEVVGEARDGEAALDLIKRLQPRIVCMDVMMPKMNGLDALREIKMTYPETAVVMVTGNASADNVQEAIMNGAVGFIVKPFNAAKVLKTLIAALLPPAS
ncbi:MAG: response regulator transcription factor [Betaproteobacteria bacterium]